MYTYTHMCTHIHMHAHAQHTCIRVFSESTLTNFTNKQIKQNKQKHFFLRFSNYVGLWLVSHVVSLVLFKVHLSKLTELHY